MAPQLAKRASPQASQLHPLLVELLDGSPVRIAAAAVASNRRGWSLNHLPWQRGQRADNDSN